MKTHVRMFKPEFWDAILSGTKRQTVRMTPARPLCPGDTLDLRGWPGKPYAKGTKHEMLGTATITAVSKITIRSYNVEVDRKFVERDTFARKDGFEDGAAMWRWFAKSYGLNSTEAFTGILIEWGKIE